jgi:hypothetical protein
MTTETAESSRRQPPTALVRGLRLLAGVVVLLAFSEFIWLWQTWPVRELLHSVASPVPVASGR